FKSLVQHQLEPPTPWNTFFTHARHLGWRPDPVLEHHVVEVPGFEHGWIQTPPIPVKQSSRNWERWILTSYEPAPKQTAPCFFHVSKERAKSELALEEDEYFNMYDDENTRLYLLPEKPTYLGLVEPEVFGCPLPRLPHFFPDHPSSVTLNELHAKTMGRWVYPRANPGELHAGLVQLRPAPALPPRRPQYVEDDRVTLNDGAYEDSDWDRMPNWHAIGYAPQDRVAQAPAAAEEPSPASAPLAARAPSPMRVDPPTPAPPSRGPNDRDSYEDITRDFHDWQTAFPWGRWEYEPGRTSRLKPEPRGRFAHYVRVAARSSLSWREFLRGLTRAACYREVEIDHVFRAEVDGRDVYGITLPDFRLAETFVTTLHRQGVDGVDVDARVLTASEYSSLAAQAVRADRWERPPAPRDSWYRGAGGRNSSYRSRRDSPVRRYRARSPVHADRRRRSPSPRTWRRSLSPRAGPSRPRGRRASTSPRRRGSPPRPTTEPAASASWDQVESSSWERYEALSRMLASWPSSDVRGGAQAALGAQPPQVATWLPPAPGPMDVDPPSMPPAAPPAMGSLFGLPLQALLGGLSLPLSAPPAQPVAAPPPVALAAPSAVPLAAASSPAPASTPPSSAPASVAPSLLSRMSDEAPPSAAQSSRSLLDRVERPSLSSRLSDGPGVPDLEDRLSEPSDERRGRKRGGRQ
ncbi:hypothetical protein K525DRAFT_245621, partial [Schizophyllum commune Loenen D]